uniref:G-protein coupled receptors family 1 profile domain-containing protein n=1 Tax=Trichogramma kaykai TaxID=54128 RepID=A0ABD2XCK1_9HYME
MHIAYVHAFVNPTLFLTLHRGLRQGMTDVCCGCCESFARWILGATAPGSPVMSISGGGLHHQIQQQQQQPPRYDVQASRHTQTPELPYVTAQAAASCDLSDVALLKPPLPPQPKHHMLADRSDLWGISSSRPKSTTSLYEDELARRPSLLLPPPPELHDLHSTISPTSSDLPSE